MKSSAIQKLVWFLAISLAVSCQKKIPRETTILPHEGQSYAQPNKARVTHLYWKAVVDFEQTIIHAVASWKIQTQADADHIIFDTKGLTIKKVTTDNDIPASFRLADADSLLGQALEVVIKPSTTTVTIYYHTSPEAESLQWLTPQQTLGKKLPFLFTQSQGTQARSWIPCQDSPAVLFTYDADVTVPKNLLVLMSASNPQVKNDSGMYHFEMKQPIPSHLMALAVGDVEFKSLSPRNGMYAEPSLVHQSTLDFTALEKLIGKAEERNKTYGGDRYDAVVLPPSFPFQGMEYPLLTFATPSILFKNSDLSLVEKNGLAPQWSNDFPVAMPGAVSVDLRFKTDIASKVHWVISDKKIMLDAIAVKEQAQKPTHSAIKFHGVSTLAAAKEKIEMPTGLTENTAYHAYMVTESNVGRVLQTQVDTLVFTTFIRQEIKEYHSVAENRMVQYLLYRPEDALKNPTKKYPMCIFLGGDGEVSTQGKIKMIRSGTLPEYIQTGNDVPLIVMSIQQIDRNWNVKLIDEGIIHAFVTNAIDTNKVYMTGISSGANGAWSYTIHYPNRLAAIVPISGGSDTTNVCNIKNVPVYAFHNRTDTFISSKYTIDMVHAINACSPTETPKLFIFPDRGHDCWRRVYDKHHIDWIRKLTVRPAKFTIWGEKPAIDRIDIYAWMLSKSK